jgi:hypothetical protein
MSGWRARLARDPIPNLLREGTPAIVARVRRDLIDDSEAPAIEDLWKDPEVVALTSLLGKKGSMAPDAVDKELGNTKFAEVLSTVRFIDRLCDIGLSIPPEGTKKPTALHKACEFVLKSMGDDGGIADLVLGETPAARGKMVALHFQGWALSALCRAGYDDDARVQKGFDFLLAHRQHDGGWAWRGVRTESAARPSSHLITGMVLRAFAASKSRRISREPRRAAELIATRFLQPDRYEDRKPASHWEEIAEPRFWVDVLGALDSVTAIGLGKENSGVRTAEAYVRSRQAEDGFWYPGSPDKGSKTAAGDRDKASALWLTLRVLLTLRRIN